MPESVSSPGLDSIQTPRIQANGLVALLVKVLRIADENKLPADISRRVERLRVTSAALEKALSERHTPSSDETALSKADADTHVDEAVKALAGFLKSVAKLPDAKGGGKALRLERALFGDGSLQWISMAYEDQWAEVKSRLDLIAAENLDETIDELGGHAILENLKDAQAAYGKALGITAEKAPKPLTASVREPFLVAIDALRRYMAVVIGHGTDADEKPEAGELAALLLAPIDEVRFRNSERASKLSRQKATAEDDVDEDGDRPTPLPVITPNPIAKAPADTDDSG